MVELPLAEIDEGAMVRDRMVLNGEDMEELRLHRRQRPAAADRGL